MPTKKLNRQGGLGRGVQNPIAAATRLPRAAKLVAAALLLACPPAWGLGIAVPPKPLAPRDSHGVRLVIVGPRPVAAGERTGVHMTVINHGRHFFVVRALVPPISIFPSVWCWGPGARYTGAAQLRIVRIRALLQWGGDQYCVLERCRAKGIPCGRR